METDDPTKTKNLTTATKLKDEFVELEWLSNKEDYITKILPQLEIKIIHPPQVTSGTIYAMKTPTKNSWKTLDGLFKQNGSITELKFPNKEKKYFHRNFTLQSTRLKFGLHTIGTEVPGEPRIYHYISIQLLMKSPISIGDGEDKILRIREETEDDRVQKVIDAMDREYFEFPLQNLNSPYLQNMVINDQADPFQDSTLDSQTENVPENPLKRKYSEPMPEENEILERVHHFEGSVRVSNRVSAKEFVQKSDIRLKTNIQHLEGALSIISNLQGVSYQWKKGEIDDKNPNKKAIGFIAQEVYKILPELVHEDPQTKILSVQYVAMIPIVVEAIKEMKKENESLKNETEGLKKETESLKKETESLKKETATLKKTPLSISLTSFLSLAVLVIAISIGFFFLGNSEVTKLFGNEPQVTVNLFEKRLKELVDKDENFDTIFSTMRASLDPDRNNLISKDDYNFYVENGSIIDKFNRIKEDLHNNGTSILFDIPPMPSAIFRNKTKEVMSYLFEDQTLYKIVALHGMGGLGKTTLSNMICHNLEIRKNFVDGIVWVTLGTESSQNLDSKLRAIVQFLGGKVSGDLWELKQSFKDLLIKKKLLIVLDDCWKFEDLVSFSLIENLNTRSRFLITTRNTDIFHTAFLETKMVALDYVTDEEGLDIMSQKIGRNITSDEKQVAWQIIRECDHLPISISLAATAVLTSMSENPWNTTLIMIQQSKLKQPIQKMLQISIDNLDPQLKQLYFYLGIFPADTPITFEAIRCVWMPEGDSKIMTTQYLQTLIERNLITPLQTLPIEQNTFTLHDLYFDYIRSNVTKLVFINQKFLKNIKDKLAIESWGDLDDDYLLNYLIYHSYNAKWHQLIKDRLVDLKWLNKRAAKRQLDGLIQDYYYVKDDSLKLIQKSFMLSKRTLESHPDQVASQLYSRLARFRNESLIIGKFLETLSASNKFHLEVPLRLPSTPLLQFLPIPEQEFIGGNEEIMVTHDQTFSIIRVWHIRIGIVLQFFFGSKPILLPNGTKLVYYQEDNIIVKDLFSGNIIHSWFSPSDHLQVTSNGKYVISASNADSILKVWSLDGKLLNEIQLPFSLEGGSLVALGTADSSMLFVLLAKKQESTEYYCISNFTTNFTSIRNTKRKSNSIKLLSDEQQLVTIESVRTSSSPRVSIWSLSNDSSVYSKPLNLIVGKQKLLQLQYPNRILDIFGVDYFLINSSCRVSQTLLSLSDDFLVVSCYNRFMEIWDTTTKKKIHTFDIPLLDSLSVSSTKVFGKSNEGLFIWDIMERSSIFQPSETYTSTNGQKTFPMTLSCPGRFWVLFNEIVCSVYRSSSYEKLPGLVWMGKVEEIQFYEYRWAESENSGMVASSLGGEINVWKINGELILNVNTSNIENIALSSLGQIITTTTSLLETRNLKDGSVISSVNIIGDPYGLTVSDDGTKAMITVKRNQTQRYCQVWDLEKRNLIVETTMEGAVITRMAGSKLVIVRSTGESDEDPLESAKALNVVDLKSQIETTISTPETGIHSVLTSKDFSKIISASSLFIQVHDSQTYSLLFEIETPDFTIGLHYDDNLGFFAYSKYAVYWWDIQGRNLRESYVDRTLYRISTFENFVAFQFRDDSIAVTKLDNV